MKHQLNTHPDMMEDLERFLCRWNYDILGAIRCLTWMTPQFKATDKDGPARLMSCLKVLVHRFDNHSCNLLDTVIQSRGREQPLGHLKDFDREWFPSPELEDREPKRCQLDDWHPRIRSDDIDAGLINQEFKSCAH